MRVCYAHCASYVAKGGRVLAAFQLFGSSLLSLSLAVALSHCGCCSELLTVGSCSLLTVLFPAPQPSEEIVRLFDWLLLLQPGGQVVYFGPVDNVAEVRTGGAVVSWHVVTSWISR